MTREPADHPMEEAVDRYLDGSLDGEPLAAMETRIARDQPLRREIERQRRVDEVLARLFQAPAPDADAGRTASSLGRRTTRPVRRRSSRWLAVAALLAIGTVAVWRMWSFLGPQPEDPYGVTEWRSMATVYHDVARTGFRAARTGRTNARLARLIERRFDEPVSFRESNDSVGPIGIGFCNTITEKTACLIARVATNESAKETERVGVLVFVDRADASAARALPRGSDLHVFERTIGRLAFYEVSPLDRPHILDRLYSPDRGDP